MTTACLSFFRNTLRASLLAAAVVSPTAFAGPTEVLFKAAFTISEVVGFGNSSGCDASVPIYPTNSTGMINGSGYASHLGKTLLASTDCIVFTSTTTFNFSSNSLVLQAANGDRLLGTYRGVATVLSPGVLQLAGFFDIKNGTGRFAGATGAGTLDGLEDISGGFSQPAAGTVMLSGKISY